MYIDKDTPDPLDITGDQIECVDHFKYLGSIKPHSADY